MPQKEIALVMGVSSGIKRAMAALLSNHEFQVYGTMRRPADGASELGDAQIVPLDVRNAESVCGCVQEALNREGGIDVLVNNARCTLIGLSKKPASKKP